jgi:hypothetical protein
VQPGDVAPGEDQRASTKSSNPSSTLLAFAATRIDQINVGIAALEVARIEWPTAPTSSAVLGAGRSDRDAARAAAGGCGLMWVGVTRQIPRLPPEGRARGTPAFQRQTLQNRL